MSTTIPAPGQIVRVRARQYLVEKVDGGGDQAVVDLACLDDDAQGDVLQVLWAVEPDAEILDAASWSRLGEKGFDPPARFGAYMHALRWNTVTATTPRLFQAPYRAGIQVMAYQLEPLRKALHLPRVNLFIADDVGLGKTIEAGLIVRELLMRQKIDRVLIAAPPSVTPQWKAEMEERFGLTFEVLDREYMLARRRERGYAVNPWTTHPRFIVSHALLRDETYAGPLRDMLGDFAPRTLLILDEAHHAAPASSSKYAVDSDLTRTIRDLAGRFEHRLFLSATPHNGHSNSFAALLEILDPQRFTRGVPVKSQKLLEAVMVRRLKQDLQKHIAGIPKRDVVQLDVDGLPADAPELVLARLLAEYTALREEKIDSLPPKRQAAARLITTSLQKRLLSSIEAFAVTLRVHRRALERQAPVPAAPPALPLLACPPGADEEGRADLDEAALAEEEAAQMAAATAAGGYDLAARERALLDQMESVAEAHRGRPDARVRELVAWLAKHACPGLPPAGERPPAGTPTSTWNRRRVLVFTEYTDTKRYLEQQLEAAIAASDRADERILTYHGGMGEDRREAVKRAFSADPDHAPVRILIATDAAREGLNLQAHCADLFHFDVPWNPSRLEQRNGRIDRKLQPEPTVRCHYFVYAQREEDQVLRALVRKTETIQQELGSLAPLLERRLESELKWGIRRSEAARVAAAIDTVAAGPKTAGAEVIAEELDAARTDRTKLGEELERLRGILAESAKHLDLTVPHFHRALDEALALGRAPALQPGDAGGVWHFPDLRHDPTWADTLDTLRPPRARDERIWEWRRAHGPRPVVFEDAGRLQDEVVHLHLEHRVVQRLLGRFLAEGFQSDLARVTALVTPDAWPRVILLGRLALYGDGASRLHEQLVAVGARWVEPGRRGGHLKPYAEEAADRTLALLERALEETPRMPDASVLATLQAGAAADAADLLPALEAAAATAAERALGLLRERGAREAREMAAIIEDQIRRIQKEERAAHDQAAAGQLALGFDFQEFEARQLKEDRAHWLRRMGQLDAELESEPARIKRGYEVRLTRITPVGLAYLWPASN